MFLKHVAQPNPCRLDLLLRRPCVVNGLDSSQAFSPSRDSCTCKTLPTYTCASAPWRSPGLALLPVVGVPQEGVRCCRNCGDNDERGGIERCEHATLRAVHREAARVRDRVDGLELVLGSLEQRARVDRAHPAHAMFAAGTRLRHKAVIYVGLVLRSIHVDLEQRCVAQ